MMRAVAVLLILTSLAGCLGGSGGADQDPLPPSQGDDAFMPRVVVAIIDTGLQPYHDEFRQLRAGEDGNLHPASYLPGYPEDAQELAITLELNSTDVSDYRDADAELWEATQRQTLYWLPGTKVVGFIGFGSDLPGGGHGTMTSSRATGNTISVAGDGALLVNIRVPLSIPLASSGDTPEAQAVRWAADQQWIDIQSNSWGMPFSCVGPAADTNTGWMDAFRYARDKHLVFSAVHNGHGNTGTVGYPSQCQDTAGPAGVIPVGATDNDGWSRWSNWFPAVSADGCANPAVREATTNEIANTGGGTSSATPFTAGGAAQLILEARRIFRDPGIGIHDGVIATLQEGGTLPEQGPLADGQFTMEELKQVLFRTAVAPPQVTQSDGDTCLTSYTPLPPGLPASMYYPLLGYGEVNVNTIDAGMAVLRGELDLPERPQEDQLYAEDQELRRQMWG